MEALRVTARTLRIPSVISNNTCFIFFFSTIASLCVRFRSKRYMQIDLFILKKLDLYKYIYIREIFF